MNHQLCRLLGMRKMRILGWTAIVISCVCVGILLLNQGKDSATSAGTPPHRAESSGDTSHFTDSASPQETLPSKTVERETTRSSRPKISEVDIDRWLDLPKEEWLAQVAISTEGMPEESRAEFNALMREFQETRSRRGLTLDHPHYIARRAALLDCYYRGYRNQLPDGSAAEKPETDTSK